MVSHTYQFHLDTDVIHLPDIGDLLGKDVEVVIRELETLPPASNFDAINQLLASQASPDFFGKIEDPAAWQKQTRNDWE